MGIDDLIIEFEKLQKIDPFSRIVWNTVDNIDAIYFSASPGCHNQFGGLLDDGGDHVPIDPENPHRDAKQRFIVEVFSRCPELIEKERGPWKTLPWAEVSNEGEQPRRVAVCYREILNASQAAVITLRRMKPNLAQSEIQNPKSDGDAEQLRLLGLQCASLINDNADSWKDAAEWLLHLPLCWGIYESHEDDDPRLLRGDPFIVNDDGPGSCTWRVFDNESETARVKGPILRRLLDGWAAATSRFRDSHRCHDRFYDFNIADAQRLVLLGALTTVRDFDGDSLGFKWPWDRPHDTNSTFEGRDWAYSMITGNIFSPEQAMIEYITTALKYLEKMPRLWKQSLETKDFPPLSPAAACTYELLIELPAHRALTGPEIIKALKDKDHFIENSTLTSRIIPELQPYGIENVRRIGYRIPASKRPS